MAAFCGALGSGAAPALETLSLYKNTIDYNGMLHLSDALERGAAPVLKTLTLYHYVKFHDNPVDAAAEQAVRDARPGLRII